MPNVPLTIFHLLKEDPKGQIKRKSDNLGIKDATSLPAKPWKTMDIDGITSCDDPITPMIIVDSYRSLVISFSHDARQQNDQRRPVLL